MNHWLKRWQIENLLILLFSFTAFLVFFLTMQNAQKQEMLAIYTNGLSEKDSITFFMEDNESVNLRDMNEQINEPFLLLKREVDTEGSIHAVMNKGLGCFLPVKEGRSFNHNDYFQHKRVAVVGEHYEGILKKGDSNYIEFAGKYFEVIGVLDPPVDSDFNKEAFINLDSFLELNPFEVNSAFVLNGRGQTKEIFSKIEEIHRPDPITSVETTSKGTERIFTVSSSLIYILLIVSTLAIQTLLTLFWIHKKKRFVVVYQLIGHSTYIIIRGLFLRYGKLLLVGGLIAGLCYLCLEPQLGLLRDGKYLSYLISGCSIYILFNLCLVAITLYNTLRKETLKVLKES